MDKELIEVITDRKKGKQTASARLLHEKLGIKTRFNDWFPRMCEYGFEENTGYVLVTQKKATNNPKNPETEITEYYLSLDMAKEICMIQRSKIGSNIRKYFIACEKELNGYLKDRKKSKEIRNTFTDVLNNRGYSKNYEYIQTTIQMKKALGIPANTKKDDMTHEQIGATMASEYTAAAALTDEKGYHEVNPVCVEASKLIAGFIEKKQQQYLERQRLTAMAGQ